MNRIATEVAPPEQAAVLAKAVLRAAEHLGVQKAELARLLGVSAASITRLHQGAFQLDPSSKAGEHALLFVRLFRSLDSIVGTREAARTWMAGPNTGLNGRPIDLIQTTQGLVHAVDYLDSHRARI
jgi:putative toxin-antitoxin system antitoxin component (TIGR02293 family)